MAFRTAARDAFIQAFKKSAPCLLEPIMAVEVEMPAEFQGPIVGDLNSHRGIIFETESRENHAIVRAEVPLANMFGYVNNLRSMSQGRAQYTMHFDHYAQVPQAVAEEIKEKLK